MLVSAFCAGAVTTWFLGPELRERLASSSARVRAEDEGEPTREELAALLWEAWDILEQEFIAPEKVVAQDMIYGAIRGMVQTLDDPYTSFVEPLPAAIMDEDMQGSFEGIGASVRMEDGRLIIERFLPGSPAREAGLLEGDAILEADGRSLEGLTAVEAIALIRGPEGSIVRLLVSRQGVDEPFVVPVRRARVELPVVQARMLDGGIAYVALSEFNAVARTKVREALKDLLREEPRGLVFDLRDNPGGYFQAAVDVAGEFLPSGAVIVSEDQRDAEPRVYEVSGKGVATEIPLVILINGSSASASEIVAGALRYHERAVLIGERTYGKGSVQNVHSLSDGSSLRVTVARYYLPGEQQVDSQGIAPDIEVSYTQEDIDAGRDPQLERAVSYLTKGD